MFYETAAANLRPARAFPWTSSASLRARRYSAASHDGSPYHLPCSKNLHEFLEVAACKARRRWRQPHLPHVLAVGPRRLEAQQLPAVQQRQYRQVKGANRVAVFVLARQLVGLAPQLRRRPVDRQRLARLLGAPDGAGRHGRPLHRRRRLPAMADEHHRPHRQHGQRQPAHQRQHDRGAAGAAARVEQGRMRLLVVLIVGLRRVVGVVLGGLLLRPLRRLVRPHGGLPVAGLLQPLGEVVLRWRLERAALVRQRLLQQAEALVQAC